MRNEVYGIPVGQRRFGDDGLDVRAAPAQYGDEHLPVHSGLDGHEYARQKTHSPSNTTSRVIVPSLAEERTGRDEDGPKYAPLCIHLWLG
jgi:hypothetical protein